MQEREKLIQRFGPNQTTKKENNRLLRLLEEYQALTSEVVPDEPFQKKDNDPAPMLAPDKAASILQTIHGRLAFDETPEREKREIPAVRKLYRRLAVAAAVVALAL